MSQMPTMARPVLAELKAWAWLLIPAFTKANTSKQQWKAQAEASLQPAKETWMESAALAVVGIWTVR